jgi:hypothetical protein
MRLPLLLALLLSTVNMNAQNILSNGNFEDYSSCPTTYAQTTRCVGWRAYTNGTPDYFNACANVPAAVPNAAYGYQPAASGNAYMGFISNSTKEYIATTISPLQIGSTYEISMSVSLANSSSMALNDLGMLFYKSGPFSVATNGVVSSSPQVWFTSQGPIIDTQNWVRVTQIFTADSAYDNIVIGGFKNWSTITPSDTMRIMPIGVISYYYVDSVVIRLADGIYFPVDDSVLCVGDSVIIPFTVYGFQPSNTFILQLSDASGSFASPTTIATINGNTSGVFRTILPNSVTAGTGYQLRIVASNPAKTVVSPVTIDIGQSMPVKPVAAGRSIACGGEPLQLNATTPSTGVTWEWSGPAGFNSNVQNPVVPNFAAANAGRYIVTARNIGCEAKDTLSVTYQAPLLPVTATNSSPACQGASVGIFTTPSTTGATYSWAGPNGYTSSVQNPVLSAASTGMSGDYTVTATLNGCTAKSMTSVIVNPVPIATASISGAVCTGGVLNLTGASSLGGSTFAWSGPAFSSTLPSPIIAPATTAHNGTYSLVVKKDGCSSAPATVQAMVYPTPAKPVVNANNITCDGSPLNLTTTAIPGAVYSWTGPNGFTSNLQNPTINPATFINAGTYTLTISVNGCVSEPNTASVTVNLIPFIGGYASPNDTICEGTLTYFVSKHKNGGSNPVFQWYKNYAPIPGANTFIYSTTDLKTGDVFYCTMYAVGVCTDPVTVSTDTIHMTVLPIVTQPSATITSVPAIPQPASLTAFTANVKHGGYEPKYQWQLNGVNLTGATNITWSSATLKPFDKVSVIVTSNDPCATNKTAYSDTVIIGFPTQIKPVEAENSINIYPNPNNGNFTIEGINTNTVVKLDIINTLGQSVYSKELKANNGKISLSDPGLTSGAYLLKLSYTGEQQTIKFSID